MSELLRVVNMFGAVGEESEGIAALGIDPIAILAQAGTFLVLFWIIKKFALSKIVATLEARHKTIDDGVRLGRQMEAEKEKLKEEIEKVLQKARQDADKIIASGNSESGEILKQAEASATRKVDAMLQDAHAKIEEDIKHARKQLEGEMLELVAEATEAILKEKLDAKKDSSLITRALKHARGA